MHKNHLKKIFRLEGYIIDRVEHLDKQVLLHCHLQRTTMRLSSEVSRNVNEMRLRKIPHMMLEDQQVVLVVTQRRFYFPAHKTKRWEPLPDVGKMKQTTNTFRFNTLRELKRDNYSGTGLRRGKSGMFASKLLDELPLELKWKDSITKIGLDGKGAKGRKMVHNITDLEGRGIVGVLPDLTQAEFKKNFRRFRRKTGAW